MQQHSHQLFTFTFTFTTLRLDPVVPSLERPLKNSEPSVGHAKDVGRFGSAAAGCCPMIPFESWQRIPCAAGKSGFAQTTHFLYTVKNQMMVKVRCAPNLPTV